jgi:hypothetical protein
MIPVMLRYPAGASLAAGSGLAGVDAGGGERTARPAAGHREGVRGIRVAARADLIQTARARAGATAFADSDASASSASRKCEDRLGRPAPPVAMSRYDRLRAQGATAHEAMTAAALLFRRPPDACTGDPGTSHLAITDIPPGEDAGLAGGPGAGTEPDRAD